MSSRSEPSEPFAAAAETHTAAVYFAGDRAYKLKKPVSTGFLDFTTAGARAAACRRETELNRRFAPDVYLGVGEFRGQAAEPAEPLVIMRRLPSARRLASLVAAGQPVGEPLRQVARQVAIQHAAAERRSEITCQGSRDALLGRWHDNLTEIRKLAEATDGELEVTEIERLAERFLAGREPLLADRMQAGRIVDGHGDLLADDVFCLDDGPRILDCLEFDDRLRWLDGLDDVSFLAMDLDRLGRPDLAEQFIDWYAEFTADPAPASLRHHYVAYRALVRAKVSCIRAAQQQPQAMSSAGQLADLALRHLHAGAVSLILVGGPPGTGKTVLAGQAAARLGCVVLGSDPIRKELAGLPPLQHVASPYRTGLYSPAWTERTYQELLNRAGRLLARGESVILDASWTSAAQRESAAQLALAVSADIVQLRCDVPADLAAGRLQGRFCDASDAGPNVGERLRAAADPWPDATPIDTSGPDGRQITPLQRALDAIRPHGPEHAWHAARPYMVPGLSARDYRRGGQDQRPLAQGYAGPVTEGMFVGDEVLLDLSFPLARARLRALSRDGLLSSASDDAYGAEVTGLMRVGPAGFSRLVRVQFRDLPERANAAGLALRWEVTGPGGALYPVLDADVELIGAGPQTTWLTLAGAYRPPLGALGEALDRAILHRVASATIRRFLGRIAAGLDAGPEPGEEPVTAEHQLASPDSAC